VVAGGGAADRLLQRGRGPETAESGMACETSSRSGLASTGPRSGDRGEPDQDRRRKPEQDAASTGPRSGDRGERTSEANWKQPLKWLQRGRGPETAESLVLLLGQHERRDASTGPRSGDRGELLPMFPNPAKRGGFNGAAVRRPRRAARSRRRRPRGGTASTGPRSGDRGERAASCSGAARKPPLQRGRGPETAESAQPFPERKAKG
jgi:hypothetical protein